MKRGGGISSNRVHVNEILHLLLNKTKEKDNAVIVDEFRGKTQPEKYAWSAASIQMEMGRGREQYGGWR